MRAEGRVSSLVRRTERARTVSQRAASRSFGVTVGTREGAPGSGGPPGYQSPSLDCRPRTYASAVRTPEFSLPRPTAVTVSRASSMST